MGTLIYVKQKMSLSIEQKHVRHLQRCAQRTTGGNVSAYVERLLAQDELRQAVTAAARWYAAHPDYAEGSEIEARTALDETT